MEHTNLGGKLDNLSIKESIMVLIWVKSFVFRQLGIENLQSRTEVEEALAAKLGEEEETKPSVEEMILQIFERNVFGIGQEEGGDSQTITQTKHLLRREWQSFSKETDNLKKACAPSEFLDEENDSFANLGQLDVGSLKNPEDNALLAASQQDFSITSQSLDIDWTATAPQVTPSHSLEPNLILVFLYAAAQPLATSEFDVLR